jgi:hypothetical protein
MQKNALPRKKQKVTDRLLLLFLGPPLPQRPLGFVLKTKDERTKERQGRGGEKVTPEVRTFSF